jgi:hypothetical protein
MCDSLSLRGTPDWKKEGMRVWDLRTSRCLDVYQAGDAFKVLRMGARGVLVCGTEGGELLIARCRDLDMGLPLVTPVLAWLYAKVSRLPWSPLRRVDRWGWDDGIKTACLWCGQCFQVSEGILNVIKDLNRNANISTYQFPCLDLPDKAWREPGLISECLLCHHPLKFNPFIVYNKGLRGNEGRGYRCLPRPHFEELL